MVAIDQAAAVASMQERPMALFEQIFSLQIGNDARINPGHQELRSWLWRTPASASALARRRQDSTCPAPAWMNRLAQPERDESRSTRASSRSRAGLSPGWVASINAAAA